MLVAPFVAPAAVRHFRDAHEAGHDIDAPVQHLLPQRALLGQLCWLPAAPTDSMLALWVATLSGLWSWPTSVPAVPQVRARSPSNPGAGARPFVWWSKSATLFLCLPPAALMVSSVK